MPSPAEIVLASYYVTLGILALYGAHRLLLVVRFYRVETTGSEGETTFAIWPTVTVQLPLYNEVSVAERLLRAVARLDYPRDSLAIQVLDDSTDETVEIVARTVAELADQGVPIEHVRRSDRRGFKAGALAAGLERTDSELVCVFDADFVPGPDFLRRTVPSFEDPEVGMVQARWGHLNRDDSLLTKVQAMLLDGHFLIEHAARHRAGCFFNFNGTAGVWRRRAIEDAGGWTSDTLTEDLDLSYRAQLAGWRFEFLPEVEVPAELPADLDAFRSQQRRWTKGSIQTARKLLPTILRSPLDWPVKLEATVHLTANLTYPLMVALALLIFPAMWFRRAAGWWHVAAVDGPLFGAATLSVLAFYLASQREAGRSLWRSVLLAPGLMAIGMGMSLNNARAAIEGLASDGGVFHRTPKRGSAATLRSRRRSVLAPEGVLVAYLVGCVTIACLHELWLSLPFLFLFLHGYLHVFLLATGLLPSPRPDPALDEGLSVA